MTKKITIYTLPHCPNCDRTKTFLDRHNVKYETVNLLDAPEKRAEFKAKGYQAAPIVQVEGGEEWAGWNGAKVRNLAE